MMKPITRRPVEYIVAEADLMTENAEPEPFTRTPNRILAALSTMKESEMRIVLTVVRETYGWNTEWVELSVSDFVRMTGMQRSSITRGIALALASQHIQREPSGKNRGFRYRITPADQVVALSYHHDRKCTLKAHTSSSLKLPKVVAQSYHHEADLPQQNAVNSAPKEKKERLKKEESVRAPRDTARAPRESQAKAPARTPRTTPAQQQQTLDRMHENCQIVEASFGAKLNPAQAREIVEAAYDIERWTRNVKAYASNYTKLYMPGLRDWYDRDEATTRANVKAPTQRPPLPDASQLERPPVMSAAEIAAALGRQNGRSS